MNNLKKRLIIYLVIFILASIFVVGNIIVSSKETGESILGSMVGSENSFSDKFVENLLKPFHIIGEILNKDNNLWERYKSAEILLFFVCLFGFGYIEFKKFNKHDYQDIEHGSGEWAKGGEEFAKSQDGRDILNRKEGFILSRNHYLGTDLKKVGINKNILVFGGSGTGKTACYIEPNVLQQLGSYVITDPKGEIYRETSNFLREQGYKVKVLNLVDAEKSDTYNPLAHIQDATDVDIIAHTIISGGSEDGKASDPFWDNTAKMLLKASIYYLLSKRPVEEQNLSSCLNIVRAGGTDETVMDKLFVDELAPSNPGRREYESIRLGAETTKRSIAISVASKLSHFDSQNMQMITGSNDLDFEQLGNEKTAIYVISPDSHSAYNYILTIFYAQLLQRLYAQADRNGGALKMPVYLLLDEFANIGRIPDFNQKLSTSRSRGLSMSIIVQSLDQLIDLYKELHENIIANCDTQIFLGSQSIKTCEYISKSLGQKTLKFESESRSKGQDGAKDSLSYSTQRQGRELMTVDELKRMGNDDEIILVRGLRPIKAKKAWYYRYHPLYKTLQSYVIRNVDEMPIPEKPSYNFFDVNEYLSNRDEEVKRERDKMKEDNLVDEIENKKVTQNQQDEDVDIQKELEKKFDELFGTDNN